MRFCIFCEGQLIYQGRIGRREWYRCRDCGVEQYCRVDDGRRDDVLAELDGLGLMAGSDGRF